MQHTHTVQLYTDRKNDFPPPFMYLRIPQRTQKWASEGLTLICEHALSHFKYVKIRREPREEEESQPLQIDDEERETARARASDQDSYSTIRQSESGRERDG